LISEDETNTMYRNVGEELSLLAA